MGQVHQFEKRRNSYKKSSQHAFFRRQEKTENSNPEERERFGCRKNVCRNHSVKKMTRRRKGGGARASAINRKSKVG